MHCFACYLVLSIQSTPFLNERCYDIGVPYNSSPVQCCLIPLQKEADFQSLTLPPDFNLMQTHSAHIHTSCIINTYAVQIQAAFENGPHKPIVSFQD